MGNAACRGGEREVKKGDILVSGRIEVLNDDGEIMQYLYRPSDADIKAKVLYLYRDVIDGTWVEMAPTGNKKGVLQHHAA